MEEGFLKVAEEVHLTGWGRRGEKNKICLGGDMRLVSSDLSLESAIA